MKFVIQRVLNANVTVEEKTVGQIDKGFLVLVGIVNDDTVTDADKLIKKLLNMRIFDDENGKINLSLNDVNGSILMVSQFTLAAECKKGNRPSFTNAKEPVIAKEMFDYIVNECKKQVKCVETGVFGAYMKVSLVNDGPFTIVLDSTEL